LNVLELNFLDALATKLTYVIFDMTMYC